MAGQRVSYLQRKTLGYCKKKANFTDTLWINLYDYNYRCHHKSLRLPLTLPGVSRFQKNGCIEHLPWQWD